MGTFSLHFGFFLCVLLALIDFASPRVKRLPVEPSLFICDFYDNDDGAS